MFISSDIRRKGTKEDCYPQGPLHRGMQPLLLVALSLRYAWASEPWRFFTATTRSWSNLSGTCPLTGFCAEAQYLIPENTEGFCRAAGGEEPPKSEGGMVRALKRAGQIVLVI